MYKCKSVYRIRGFVKSKLLYKSAIPAELYMSKEINITMIF